MADGLFDQPLATRLLEAADGEGLDLRGALAASDEVLRRTEIAQPALLFVELVLAEALPADVEVVGVAGHSVGEYAAVCSAGAYTPEDTMRLVIRRGAEMAGMTEGTMAAVLGLDDEVLEGVCAEVRSEGEVVVVANFNAPGQTVVSGSLAGVEKASARARERGARRVVPLNVSGAFHSPLMAPATARLAPAITATELHPLRVPVACNVDGVALADAGRLPDRLARQLESPVRWIDCVRTLADLGAQALVEVGPGSVLTGLARRIVPELTAVSVRDLGAAAALVPLQTGSA